MTEPNEQVERYLAGRFEFAAPGDQQEDAWILRFCDKDMREAIFTGPDAEREVWEAWDKYAPAWNIYLFRLAHLSRPESRAGEGESVRRVRHMGRGTVYREIGGAELQAATGPVEEGAILTIYRAEHDGKLWARRASEFGDGRFERIEDVAAPAGELEAVNRGEFTIDDEQDGFFGLNVAIGANVWIEQRRSTGVTSPIMLSHDQFRALAALSRRREEPR